MSDDHSIFEPDLLIDDLEECETFLTGYLRYLAEILLGPPGQLITASHVWFDKLFPDHVAVFNANVCIAPPRKIWFGDIDLTEDERGLAVLAKALDTKVYVLNERDGRFQGRDEQPLLERAVLNVSPDGSAVHAPHIRRAEDGRLRPVNWC
jgi:hypothetical protein